MGLATGSFRSQRRRRTGFGRQPFALCAYGSRTQALIFFIRFLTPYLMRTIAERMSDFPRDVPCTVPDSARTVTKAVPYHSGGVLDPVADRLGSLLGGVDRMYFA